MDLVFLHGAPAAGKLTIAQALRERIPEARVFDNHAAIDFAKTLIPFDGDGFWPLVQTLRLTALRTAGPFVKLAVYTACYSHPEDLAPFEELEQAVTEAGGRVLPVYVRCDRAALRERVTDPGRAARGKLATVDGLEAFLTRWNIAPVPRGNVLEVDTAHTSPAQAAGRIAVQFDL